MAVAIVLVEPADLIGHAINLATGRRGWSHCFVDPDWPHMGRDPVVIDISRERGVELSTWSRAAGPGLRQTYRIDLDVATGRHVLDRIVEHIGRPYGFGSMLLQPLQRPWLGTGAYCSRVVADCLPLAVRCCLPRCPCPADLIALPSMLRERGAA